VAAGGASNSPRTVDVTLSVVRDPQTYLGRYVLAPEPTTACDMGTYGTWTAYIEAARVTAATLDTLELMLEVRVASTFGTFYGEGESGATLDATTQSFAGSGPVVLSGGTNASGTGTFAVTGTFTGADTFTAHVAGTFQLTIQDGFGGSTTRTCSEVSVQVTGTRSAG
jgi:hypothetical protein